MPTPISSTVVPLSRTGWVASTNDATFGAASNAIDGSNSTLWATNSTMPVYLILDMLTPQTFDTVAVLPRQDGFLDFPGSIEIYVSSDGVTWGTAVYTASGLPNTATLKTFGPFSGGAVTKRYVKYNILSAASGARAFQGAAEVNVGSFMYVYAVMENFISIAANHQPVRTPSAVTFTPTYYDPVPVAAALKGGTPGSAYTETVSAQGGTSPYTFALTSGALPTGTTLNSTTGVISGTPTTVGSYTFTITVTDSIGFTGSQAFTIVISAASSGGGSYTFIC